MAKSDFYKNVIVKIGDVIEYENNARIHSKGQIDHLEKLIKRFGFTNPILIDEDKNVIAGHGRLMAAKQVGLEEVPAVVVTGLSEKDRALLVIADNKMAENSTWDDDLLLTELQSLGADFELTGFNTAELADLLNVVEETDFPDLPTGDKEPFQQITFTLHDEQHEIVDAAVTLARTNPLVDTGLNENANGNGIALICSEWLAANGVESDDG